MASGIGRYYQFAKCFRDEDLRIDRQPEFTQLDLEMSFATQDDICFIIENLLSHLWKTHFGIDLVIPFKKMTYEVAMSKYGSDKPDLRYGLEIYNISSFIPSKSLEYPITEAIVIKNGSAISTEKLQMICEKVSTHHQPVIALNLLSLDNLEKWAFKIPFTLAPSISDIKYLNDYLGLEVNDAIFLSSRPQKHSGNMTQMGRVRQLFPLDDDIHLLEKAPESVRANHYDIVVNGVEIGGGSIRIHDAVLQKHIMENILKISQYEINQFSHLFKILSSGCPPHGGIALVLGFDRLIAIMHGSESIRDVIAFPKTCSGIDPVVESPGEISEDVLEQYHLCQLKSNT
ncbi:hypothetical protein PCK2_000436 [Pneumocystis canis]|nr:hypothetical protein PCK2_000436 [Pneumocystis canis]